MHLSNLYVRVTLFASIVFLGSACLAAQSPSSVAPSNRVQQQGTSAPKADDTSIQKPAQTPPAETAPATTQENDAIVDLIGRAEKEYQAGLDNYRAGKTDEARQNFDNALNNLLGSSFDVRSDERLEKEFDRIVNGVNELYPGGTPENDQAAQDQQQKAEPAPIDETNDIAPAPTASAKAKAEVEIRKTHSDLPLMMTDQVAGYITYFSGRGRGVFERAYIRSGRYRDMILSSLKQEGVPQDLIYLAQAESGFHPLAVSRVGARGIWQFMAGRGKGYGLNHSQYVDDRQDPVKSTRAAAHHLKDLYNQFGDWYLAMAAYNSGPGTVQAAVKRTGYADFWELYKRNVLPKETRNYVPIILAVTIMTKNPSQYGLEGLAMDHPADYDTVTLNYPVDLRLVADCIHSTTDALQELNPSLLRMTTPHTGSFELYLPAGTKEQYETAIASVPPDKRLTWRYHEVLPGDSVATLARTYHTTPKQIEEANHLDGPELEAHARLVIPVAPGKHPDTDGATYSRRITRYKVRRGDTIESVAENFGISPTMLKRWNGLRGNSLAGRRVIALHLPISPGVRESDTVSSRSRKSKTETADAKPPATKSAQVERMKTETAVVHHTVRAGETLYSIANAYRTTVTALKRDNRNIADIRPGMILTIQLVR
jgi:membrane-bound lytic murein transglycosylase D